MTLPSYATDFRGHPACPCQKVWIPAYEHELQRRGLLETGQQLHIYQLIGDYSGSGNTHLLGGVGDYLDLPGDNDQAVWVARQMGADPTWHRFHNWDGKGGIEHDHSVLRGCPHLAQSALDQVWAVDHNGDGLVGDAPDPGPRPLSGRTWKQGIEWAIEQEENDVDDATIDKIADRVVAKLTGGKPDGADLTRDQLLKRGANATDRVKQLAKDLGHPQT